jgi:hypothetical protein
MMTSRQPCAATAPREAVARRRVVARSRLTTRDAELWRVHADCKIRLWRVASEARLDRCVYHQASALLDMVSQRLLIPGEERDVILPRMPDLAFAAFTLSYKFHYDLAAAPPVDFARLMRLLDVDMRGGRLITHELFLLDRQPAQWRHSSCDVAASALCAAERGHLATAMAIFDRYTLDVELCDLPQDAMLSAILEGLSTSAGLASVTLQRLLSRSDIARDIPTSTSSSDVHAQPWDPIVESEGFFAILRPKDARETPPEKRASRPNEPRLIVDAMRRWGYVHGRRPVTSASHSSARLASLGLAGTSSDVHRTTRPRPRRRSCSLPPASVTAKERIRIHSGYHSC